MTIFQTLSVLFALTAFFSFVNQRFLKLPATIGIMILTVLFSLGLIAVDRLVFPIADHVKPFLLELDLNEALLHGMLGALLFAGAMQLDFPSLARNRYPVIALSTAGVLVSTLVVAGASYLLAQVLHLDLGFKEALVFGALISPTDPVAVLGILKKAGCQPSLEASIVGESLFNDGVGIVVFTLALQFLFSPDVSWGEAILLFVRQAVGGIACGFFVGYIAYLMMKRVDHYPTELLITIAIVTSGYAFAEELGVSAPIGAVVAGLLIGYRGRSCAMSKTTEEHLDLFWSLVDEVLNALLFVLIGLDMLVIPIKNHLLFSLCAILVVLLGRLISVAGPLALLRGFSRANPGALPILTWGGLRGGISIALALSLPAFPGRDLLLTATFAVVVFSVVVQGGTIGLLVEKLARRRA